MQDELSGYHDVVSALFSYEFIDGGIDLAALRRLHAGDLDEWLTALERSGMLAPDAIELLGEQWRRSPRALLDALLEEADDVTRRRCLAAWAALDRDDPVTRLG